MIKNRIVHVIINEEWIERLKKEYNSMSEQLVYIGKVLELNPIPNADFIELATVDCGEGGKWKGVVKKGDFQLESLCEVYLPDSVVPEISGLDFLKNTNWRVRMRIFKGCPSEVVITKCFGFLPIGTDITINRGVKKYVKHISANLAGIAKGHFPNFIPKTDEPNFQKCEEMIELLKGHPYFITEKMDGSSSTAYKWKGNFGVCSRNLELEENDENAYWKVANKYNLRENLPEGIALQWETCGPKIQKNPHGLKDIEGFAFSAFDIANHRFLDFGEFLDLTEKLNFPIVRLIHIKDDFVPFDFQEYAKGKYANGHTREGIVIRSQELIDGKLISFKVINLEYEECEDA